MAPQANRIGTLAKASFRDAEFFVESDKLETGRRLVVHQFPHRDTPYVEDMGRDANKVQVTAYVANAGAEQAAQALRSACDQRGAATLRLPLESLKAHCEKCTRDFAKDKLGYIAFSLQFVRDGDSAAPVPVAYLARLVFAAAGGLAGPLTALATSQMRTLGLPSFVADSAAGVIRDAVSAIDAVRASLPIAEASSAALALRMQDLHGSAASLAVAGSVPNTWSGAAFFATQRQASAAPLVTAISDAITAVRIAATDQAAAARELSSLVSFEIEPQAGIVYTAARRQEQANAQTIAQIVRVRALAERAVALTEAEITDRRAAIAARASIAEEIDAELDRLAGSDAHPVYVALSDVRGRAAEHFTRLLADLAPVVRVGVPQSMPSLWWANALYGDATRAGELAARNRVIHPSFMPIEIEALAR